MEIDGVRLDRVQRDADRVVLCRCGGFGRVEHRAVHAPGETEAYVRAAFSCEWPRSGPHAPVHRPARAQSVS